jgi:hypothetical protein
VILALQCYPGDSHHALELTKLIADIEPQPRNDVLFCLAHRKDTPEAHVKAIIEAAATKFPVHVVAGKRNGTGWPVGPNDLWSEAMLRISLARKDKRWPYTAVLTFEADCIPLRTDWINVLKANWSAAHEAGHHVCGHAHESDPGKPPDHINGNGIFRIGLCKTFPELAGSSAAAGWDAFHGQLLMKLACDTDAIYQVYGLRDYDRARIESINKNGFIPALFHGTKGAEGIRIARAMLRDGALAANAAMPAPGIRPIKTAKDYLPTATDCPKTQET